MAINIPRIIPGLTGAEGIDNGTTGAEKLNQFFEEVESLANEIAPNKMDEDGNNSEIDAIWFNPNTLSELSNVGELKYSAASNTLEFKNQYAVFQLGQVKKIIVKNDEGSQVSSGKIMYISSAVSNTPFAKLASTSLKDSAYKSIGMTTNSVETNGFVALTTEGRVSNLNTSSFIEGDLLWLGTNGSITNVEPIAPTPKIFVGIVLRSHANAGKVYVKIRRITEVSAMPSVNVTEVKNQDVLKWNSETERFENSNIALSINEILNISGDATISGEKTFQFSPVVPNGTSADSAVNKAQVDTGDMSNRSLLEDYKNNVEYLKIDENGFLIAYAPNIKTDIVSVDSNGNLIITIQ